MSHELRKATLLVVLLCTCVRSAPFRLYISDHHTGPAAGLKAAALGSNVEVRVTCRTWITVGITAARSAARFCRQVIDESYSRHCMIVNISTCLHLKVRSAALLFRATPEQPLAALVSIQDPLFLLRDLESSLSFCPRPYQTRRAFFERYREQFHSVDGFACSVRTLPGSSRFRSMLRRLVG